MNGLFAALLRELGYEVTLLSARVSREQGGFGPEFDHLVLLVSLDRQWLANVGFGSSFLEPLLLSDQGQQIEGRYAYRLARAGGDWRLMARESEGAWSESYLFTLQPRQFADFSDMCHFHQSSPQSHFTQRRVCTRATDDGRVTLRGNRLIVTSDGHREEHPLVDEDDFAARLQEHFGIVLNTRFPQTPPGDA